MPEKVDPVELTIQIVNFNTAQYLRNCLASIFRDLEGSDISHEVSVLDNASTDSEEPSELDKLKEEYGNRVKFVQNDRNVGFGAGHNKLAEEATGTRLLILNPDVIIDQPRTIQRLNERLDANPKVGIVGPALVDAEGNRQLWDHGEDMLPFISLPGLFKWTRLTQPQQVTYVSGAIMLIEKIAFDEVGGFDENFFLYHEETDLAIRARKKGYQSEYHPDIQATHIGSVVAGKDNGPHFDNSTLHFFQKHYPLPKYLRFLSPLFQPLKEPFLKFIHLFN